MNECLDMALRVILWRYKVWLLSAHTGLWQAFRAADLRLRGRVQTVNIGFYKPPSFRPVIAVAIFLCTHDGTGER